MCSSDLASSPITVDPRLPKMLNDVILMAVAKDANARFQTAAALRNALSHVVSGPKPAAVAAVTAPLPAPVPLPTAAVPVGELAQPAASVSHRGAWMGLGAVVAVLAIVAVIAIAPWKKTSATPASVAAPVAPAAASEPPASVAAQPEPQAPPAAAPVPQVSAPVSAPVNVIPRLPSRTPGVAKSVPAVSQAAVAEPLVQQTPAPTPQPLAPQQPAAPAAPSRAELQEVRESLALVSVRAAGIRTSLQSLQRSQGGLNLRGDMQAAANLMSTYLDGAEAALNAGDVAQARTFLEKAEPQVQKLEKFFNR